MRLLLPPAPLAAIAVGGVLLLRALLRRGGAAAPALPVDPYAPHEPASGFDPTPKPGAIAFRKFIIDRWGERPGSPQNIGRWDRTDKPSEHHEGRAWDLMTRDKAHGQAVVDALLAPEGSEPHALARRAGLSYIIWNKQIWRAYPWGGKPAGSWSPYSGASTHEDHVHFSLSRAGGRGDTSLYKMTSA